MPAVNAVRWLQRQRTKGESTCNASTRDANERMHDAVQPGETNGAIAVISFAVRVAATAIAPSTIAGEFDPV